MATRSIPASGSTECPPAPKSFEPEDSTPGPAKSSGLIPDDESVVDDILSWDWRPKGQGTPGRDWALPAKPEASHEASHEASPLVPPQPVDKAAKPKWYLGFDCATKTFAFSLSRIDLDAFAAAKTRLRTCMRAALEVLRRASATLDACRGAGPELCHVAELVRKIAPVVAAADLESKSFVRIADGETVDLFPGRADEDIATVERLRAVSRYVGGRIRPAIQRIVPVGEAVRIIIEFQLGANAPSRAVAAALVTLFAEEDVRIVGPTLKNKIATCEEGRYYHFAAKYSTSYGANKAHAKYNFARIEEVFGTEIPPTRPPALRGHIADSFMQIVGDLVHGSDENAASLF